MSKRKVVAIDDMRANMGSREERHSFLTTATDAGE
jgi:hypothetical protein